MVTASGDEQGRLRQLTVVLRGRVSEGAPATTPDPVCLVEPVRPRPADEPICLIETRDAPAPAR